LKLGADASIAAGPGGRAAETGTDIKPNSETYAYSRSKGLFAGISLDGAVVSMDNSANQKVYGVEGRATSSPVTMPLQAALREYSPHATK
jgi:lipid-binding SYLF domain-containing protein